MRASAFLLLLVVALTGCGHRSTYVRETAAPGEIVWAYDDALVATQDGQPVARPNGWGGLAGAVACVDEARVYAEEAETKGTWGEVLSYGGLMAVSLSPFLGIAAAVGVSAGYAALANDPRRGAAAVPLGVLTGLGTTGMLFVGGYVATAGGSVLTGQAMPAALDAVNVYNDNFMAHPGCRREP